MATSPTSSTEPTAAGGPALFDACYERAVEYVRVKSAAEGITWSEQEWLAVELAAAAGVLATVEELEARAVIRRG